MKETIFNVILDEKEPEFQLVHLEVLVRYSFLVFGKFEGKKTKDKNGNDIFQVSKITFFTEEVENAVRGSNGRDQVFHQIDNETFNYDEGYNHPVFGGMKQISFKFKNTNLQKEQEVIYNKELFSVKKREQLDLNIMPMGFSPNKVPLDLYSINNDSAKSNMELYRIKNINSHICNIRFWF